MVFDKEYNNTPYLFGDLNPDITIRQLINVAAYDENVSVRQSAIRALGGFGGPLSFMYLRDVLLNDSSDEVRATAAESLVHSGTPAALRILRKVISDPVEKSDLVRSSSVRAIDEILRPYGSAE